MLDRLLQPVVKCAQQADFPVKHNSSFNYLFSDQVWGLSRQKAVAIMCLVTLALLGPNAFGQAVYGNIIGTVVDQSGAAVANAKVIIIDTQRQVTVTTSTNSDGNFTQRALIAGTYQVR